MPSAFTHAVAASSIGAWFAKSGISKRAVFTAAVCSAIPDIDVIGFRFGIKYGDFWGHRGFTHSIVFAAILAIVVVLVAFHGQETRSRWLLIAYIFLATASHGALDALTNGGLGVAFFSPFDTTRYFFPWQPIRVAPISPTRFFTARGLSILESEICWVWIPAVLFAGIALAVTHRRFKTSEAE